MKISLLSDNDILKLTNKKCVINEWDYNLRYKDNLPVPGGLFDYELFGQPHESEESQRFKLAYYLLCTPVIYPTKLRSLVKFMQNKLPMIRLYSNMSYTLKLLIFNYYYLEECLEVDAQFEKDNKYYKLNITLIDSEDITISNADYKYLGLMGLKNLSNYNLVGGDSLSELSNYININLLISNPIDRPTTLFKQNKKTVTILHQITQNYKILINLDKKIKEKLYSEDSNETSLFEKCLLSLSLNDMVSEMIMSHNLIGKSSKETMIRSLLSTRIKKSGRTTIVGDPSLPLNKVSIPRSLLYNTLKSDIIDLIEKNNLNVVGRIEYNNFSKLSQKYFNELLEDLVVIINRNPSLHKYNMLSFKVIPNDDFVMKLPLLITKVFGADFDGDTMSFYTITDKKMQQLALDTMSAQSTWVYEKHNNYLYTPRHEILHGLNLLTKIDDTVSDVRTYTNLQDIELDISNNIIYDNTAISYNNKITCYGRLLINDIFQFDIFDEVLNGECISPKNIKLLMSVINSTDSKIEMLNSLQKIALNAATLLTNSVMNINELFNLQNSLIHNENATIEDQIKREMNQEFKDIMMSNDRLKFNSLVDMIAKTDDNEKNTTLLEGMTESYYLKHAMMNRMLLNIKQQLVPISGYITRQLASLGMNLTYVDDINEQYKTLIVEKSWLKNNRIIAADFNDGKIEIISTVFNNSNNVYKNEIDNDRFNYTNEHPIGLSLMTSLTEELTQSALSLKHGGRLYFDDNIQIRSNVDSKVDKIVNNILYLTNKQFYIIPKEFSSVNVNDVVKKDDILLWGTARKYVDYKLEGFKLLVDLNANKLLNKSEKSICYAPHSGILTYDLTPQRYNKKYVDGLVKINGAVIDVYNKDLVYLYGNNSRVNQYDRISTGIIHLKSFSNLTSLKETFYVFCKQYYELFNNDVNVELLEILFKLIYENQFSVKESLKNKEELLDSLAYGNIKTNISKFLNDLTSSQEKSLIYKVLLCQ